jgi:hypothetical protein
MNPTEPQRVRIDRLELDLRGIDPAVAQAAVHALGPALARALAERGGAFHGAAQADAGQVTPPSPAAPGPLAAAIAGRIAGTVRGDAS